MPLVRSRVMIGRDAELQQLTSIAADVRAGVGRVVLVTGEAGVGKSRLLHEFEALLLAEGGWLTVFGHGVEMDEGELPFGVLAESLRDLVRRVGVGDIRQALGPHGHDLGCLVPSLGRTAPVWDRARILGAAATLFDVLSKTRPLCWIVEDLQWADRQTRDLFALLARSVSRVPILMVASVRPSLHAMGEAPKAISDLESLPATTTIPLARLDDSKVRTLLAELGVGSLGKTEDTRFLSLAEGLPLFVELLAGTGTLSEASSELPSTVTAAVLARLPTLHAETRRVLAVASLGQGLIDVELLEQACSMSASAFTAALDQLAAEGLLVVAAGPPSRVTFRHALVREAVASALGPGERVRAHRGWAQALEEWNGDRLAATFGLARHWDEASDARRALVAACRAADLAAEIGDGVEEGRQWRDALRHARSVGRPQDLVGIDRDEMLFNLASCAVGGGIEWSEILSVVEAEYRLGMADPVGRAWMALLRAARRGSPAPDSAALAAWSKVLEGAPITPRVVHATIVMRWLERVPNEQTSLLLERIVAAAPRLKNRRARMWPSVTLALDLFQRGRHQAGIDLLQALVEHNPDACVADLWMFEMNMMYGLLLKGEYRKAVDIGERAIARVAAPELLPGAFASLASTLADAYIALGMWDRAASMGNALPGLGRQGAQFALLNEVQLSARRGVEESVSGLSLELQESIDAKAHRPVVIDVKRDVPVWSVCIEGFAADAEAARVHDLLPAVTQPLALSVEPIAVWQALNMALRMEERSLSASRQRHDQDDEWRAGRAAVELIHQTAGIIDLPGPLGGAYRAEHAALMARLEGNDHSELWQVAVAAWHAVERVWDEAICQVSLAESLAAHDDLATAGHILQCAYGTARQLGAQPLQDRMAALARKMRIRLPDEEPQEGVSRSLLTARELEVLALVAEGRSNGQLASTLYISPKTASVHVSHILAKLQAANRTEAVAIARRSGWLP